LAISSSKHGRKSNLARRSRNPTAEAWLEARNDNSDPFDNADSRTKEVIRAIEL
jgi:hypothetical protein